MIRRESQAFPDLLDRLAVIPAPPQNLRDGQNLRAGLLRLSSLAVDRLESAVGRQILRGQPEHLQEPLARFLLQAIPLVDLGLGQLLGHLTGQVSLFLRRKQPWSERTAPLPLQRLDRF